MGQQSAQDDVQMEGDTIHALDATAEKSGDFRALSRCLVGLISSWS